MPSKCSRMLWQTHAKSASLPVGALPNIQNCHLLPQPTLKWSGSTPPREQTKIRLNTGMGLEAMVFHLPFFSYVILLRVTYCVNVDVEQKNTRPSLALPEIMIGYLYFARFQSLFNICKIAANE